MTDEEARKKDREARLDEAWTDLALNKSFKTVFEQHLQQHFSMFGEAFRSGDGYNTHAAAKRDGHKDVLNFIARRLARGKAMLDADESAPNTTEAKSEFQGTPP